MTYADNIPDDIRKAAEAVTKSMPKAFGWRKITDLVAQAIYAERVAAGMNRSVGNNLVANLATTFASETAEDEAKRYHRHLALISAAIANPHSASSAVAEIRKILGAAGMEVRS